MLTNNPEFKLSQFRILHINLIISIYAYSTVSLLNNNLYFYSISSGNLTFFSSIVSMSKL